MIVSPGLETQLLLDSIHDVRMEEIGSSKFFEAFCINLERLSIQAHLTAGVISSSQADQISTTSGELTASFGSAASTSQEEYIVEAFLENPNKLEDLVKTLLALEYWRDNILFRKGKGSKDDEEEVEFEIEGGERDIFDEYASLNDVDGGDVPEFTALASLLAGNGNAVRGAFILHAETTIVSIFNLVFYRGIPASFLEGDGEQYLLSLVDYCARQLVFLGTPEGSNPALCRQKCPLSASDLKAYLETRSRLDEIRESVHDETYKAALAAVSLSRYLCENIEEVPASIVSRMLDVHDFPLLMAALIEEPPWTRRRKIEQKDGDRTTTKIVWEKLNDNNEWSEVLPENLLVLTKLEGQPWLAVFHLTASKVCREAYRMDEFRKGICRLRRYIHEALTDQLPVLQEVARYLDELSILGVPAGGGGASSGLLLQRVDLLRESVIGYKSKSVPYDEYLESIVKNQWDKIYSCVTDSTDEDLKRLAFEVYGG